MSGMIGLQGPTLLPIKKYLTITNIFKTEEMKYYF